MSVYFVQAGEGGPVKIGFSQNFANRLSGFGTHNAAALLVLGVMDGTAADEADLHHHFAVHRLRGEWFSPHQDILAFAANCPQVSPQKRRRFSTGRNKLADYLEAHGLTLNAFAKQIGRSVPTVSRIARGKNRPDWPTMDAIFRVTNGTVTPDDFARAPKGQASAA